MSIVKRFNKSNFTIDHILNVAGVGKQNLENVTKTEDKKFEWLNCTRYKPPKLPRQKKKDGVQRRKLGRNPRIPFSSSQVAFLEAKFLRTPYLSSSDVTQLATYLKLSETRVKIWFQNRRARERREKNPKPKEDKHLKSLEKSTTPPPPKEEGVAILPLNFPLDYSNSFRYITTGPANYLQIVAPLDLTDRQIGCRPK